MTEHHIPIGRFSGALCDRRNPAILLGDAFIIPFDLCACLVLHFSPPFDDRDGSYVEGIYRC